MWGIDNRLIVLVSGKMPPGKKPPGKKPKENCPAENYSPEICPLENCHPENCPSGKMHQRKIVSESDQIWHYNVMFTIRKT